MGLGTDTASRPRWCGMLLLFQPLDLGRDTQTHRATTNSEGICVTPAPAPQHRHTTTTRTDDSDNTTTGPGVYLLLALPQRYLELELLLVGVLQFQQAFVQPMLQRGNLYGGYKEQTQREQTAPIPIHDTFFTQDHKTSRRMHR